MPFALFFPDNHERHFEPGHPERPGRLLAIRKCLEESGNWGRAVALQGIPVSEPTLSAIHTTDHVATLRRLALTGGRSDSDTFLTTDSFDLALASAAGALAAANAVWRREVNGAFALCRPPGHHATQDTAMGFCLLNNVALAAQYLIDAHEAKRIAIVDIDLHHGNGTQDIFYRRKDVHFFSIHEWPLYPGSGALDETGMGHGRGSTTNVPLPPYSGDDARQAALHRIIIPLLARFSPEIILVSIGMDAHWKDPLGNQRATTSGYAQFIKDLRAWSLEYCQRDLALVLEGGYHLEAISSISDALVSDFLDLSWEDPLGDSPEAETNAWQDPLRAAANFWQVD